MITPTPTKQDLVRSLRSTVCPACAKQKKAAQTLCYGCYRKLTTRERAALYDRLGAGYEEAVADAMESLSVTTFPLPTEPQ